MNVSRQVDPRANQKERTRAAIVDAATDLVRSGVTPTVQAAAEAAKVSRATAYRYFPTQDSLLNEVLYVTPSTEIVDENLKGLESKDPEARLLWLLDFFNPIVLQEEVQYRAAIRIALETWFASNSGGRSDAPRVRAGRRMRWLDEVLAPLRGQLPETSLRRLEYALSLTIGPDSVVILKDVCGLDEDAEILGVLRWTALAILRAALDEAGLRSAGASA
ncbi:MAG: TetR/AcrR family transcriptional regulator [Dehalococcoidia bacterium]